MQKPKLSVLVVFFSYGGNGATASLIPQLKTWWAETLLAAKTDPDLKDIIERIGQADISDTPITMTRNRAARLAIEGDHDILMMVDSDNEPDLFVGHDPTQRPFFKSSLLFAYERLLRGLPTVVAAPYCGPPPHPIKGGYENIYCFYWDVTESPGSTQSWGSVHPVYKLEPFTRTHAALMRGIQSAGALPTGLSMYTTSKYGQHTNAFGLITPPYFYYEWKDQYQTEKASTEDVTNTRDISLAGYTKLREDVVFCNWDSWAGHWKPKCVSRPCVIPTNCIADSLKEAVLEGVSAGDVIREVDFTSPEGAKSAAPYFRDLSSDAPVKVSMNNHEEEGPLVPTADGKPFIYQNASHDDNGRLVPEGENFMRVKFRRIGNRRVTMIGNETPEVHLNVLTNLVSNIAASKNRPLRIVEIGSWVGESAIAMAAGFTEKYGGHIWCVDTWEGSPNDFSGQVASRLDRPLYSYFEENTKDIDSIQPIRGKSVEVAALLDPQEADLIFIDADHSYESCKADIEAWFPHLAEDGIMVGHDYMQEFPGVKKAVDEFFRGTPVAIRANSIWMVQKAEHIARRQALAKNPNQDRSREILEFAGSLVEAY